MHVWSSRAVVCEPSFTRQPESPYVHISRVPAFKNTNKIPRKDPKRGKKRAKFCGGEKEKSAKFWAVRRRAVRRRVGSTLSCPHPFLAPPTLLAPTLFLCLGPHPFGPSLPLAPHSLALLLPYPSSPSKSPQLTVAKTGRGKSRSWPK